MRHHIYDARERVLKDEAALRARARARARAREEGKRQRCGRPDSRAQAASGRPAGCAALQLHAACAVQVASPLSPSLPSADGTCAQRKRPPRRPATAQTGRHETGRCRCGAAGAPRPPPHPAAGPAGGLQGWWCVWRGGGADSSVRRVGSRGDERSCLQRGLCPRQHSRRLSSQQAEHSRAGYSIAAGPSSSACPLAGRPLALAVSPIGEDEGGAVQRARQGLEEGQPARRRADGGQDAAERERRHRPAPLHALPSTRAGSGQQGRAVPSVRCSKRTRCAPSLCTRLKAMLPAFSW